MLTAYSHKTTGHLTKIIKHKENLGTYKTSMDSEFSQEVGSILEILLWDTVLKTH